MTDKLERAKAYLATLQSPETTLSNPTLEAIIQTVRCIYNEITNLSKDDDNELAVEIENIISATQKAAIRLCFATAFNNIEIFQTPRTYNSDHRVANLAEETRRFIEERELDIDKAANGNPFFIFGPNYLSLVKNCKNALAADLKSAITNAYLLGAEGLLGELKARKQSEKPDAPPDYNLPLEFSKYINKLLESLKREIPLHSSETQARQDKITSDLAEIIVDTCLAHVNNGLENLTKSKYGAKQINDFLNSAPHILNKAAGSVTGLRSPEEQATALESISKLRSSLKPAVINACLTISERKLSDLETAPENYKNAKKLKKDYNILNITGCIDEINALFFIAENTDPQDDLAKQAIIQMKARLDPALIRASLANAGALVDNFKETEHVPSGYTYGELTVMFNKMTLDPDRIPTKARLSQAIKTAEAFKIGPFKSISEYFNYASSALQRMAAEQQLPPPARFGRRSPS